MRMKNQLCLVCGFTPCDPAHVKTFKLTGSDANFNIVPLCRGHHMHQHAKGWGPFLTLYPWVRTELERIGWEISEKKGGGVLMSHPELKK